MEANHQEKHVTNHFEAGSNCQVFNGNISGCVFAMPGSTVTQQAPAPSQASAPASGQQPDLQARRRQPDLQTLVACQAQVRDYFWSDCSAAFLFCVCRDCYGYANNMSQFERDFACQEGLLANTFRNNPYMRLHIDKWQQQGAKRRVLRLVEAYKKAVEERLEN